MSEKPEQKERKELDEERLRVIAAIRKAFQSVRREGGITIHEADVLDDYGNSTELAAARQKDNENCWQDVPSDKIERLSWVYSFLDLKGFRFYIPAYMIWTLENLSSKSDSGYSTILSLQANNKKKFALFNFAQSVAIHEFLSFMSKYQDCKDSKKAIDRYWRQFRNVESRGPP